MRDIALAVSEYVDLIGIRLSNSSHYPKYNELFHEFCKYSSKSVINLECDKYHPAQGLADLKTIKDNIKDYQNKKIVLSWAYSPSALRVPAIPQEQLILFSRFMNNITLVHPKEFRLDPEIIDKTNANLSKTGNKLNITHEREEAYKDATVIYARNWATREYNEHGKSEELLGDASFMHCLPVHREYEATNEVIDSNQSLIKVQMKNRESVQKRLLELLLNNINE
ncbi:MAG: Ornithine carbamoyltransferase [uncultured Campylobacterales bacterium]|uniref:Ornithine carbamoyltransferase n=1 Tax=uncultured Campylobacterales bacterium TaxID=352960 RepID=A0A6S6S646_9BACT|nr:MAG: Ornithine carbamoyltransferase [uncultured Campylobacterales bacterium]